MPEKWTGNLIGKMHNEKITYDDLARELGICKGYISAILNGKKKPKGIQEKLETAVNEIIKRR